MNIYQKIANIKAAYKYLGIEAPVFTAAMPVTEAAQDPAAQEVKSEDTYLTLLENASPESEIAFLLRNLLKVEHEILDCIKKENI